MTKLTTLACCCLAITCVVTLSAQSSETTTKTAAPANDGRALDPTISAPALSAPSPPPRVSPQQHLTEAQVVLAGVSDKSLSTRAQKDFSQLQKDFAALASSYAEAQPLSSAWQSTFYNVERDLVRLIGGGGPLTPVVERETIPGLSAEVPDSATRVSLQAFRSHVELFYDAATTPERGVALTPPSALTSSR